MRSSLNIKIFDYIYYTVNTTFLIYNLFMFYQSSYATCFDHNFGHHQALNEHISSNQTHWIQYGSVSVNRLLRSEYIMGIYFQSYYYD
jgi:hypothetical protein